MPTLAWTNQLEITQKKIDDLNKLLDFFFGLSISTQDIDKFLEACIKKKILH